MVQLYREQNICPSFLKGGAANLSNKASKNADELLKQAYEKHYTYVYKFCLSRLLSDRASAEDCAQEAYIVLYNKLKSGEEIDNTLAFLLQTARNFVLKQVREIEKRKNEIDLDDVIHIPSQSDEMDEKLSFEEYSRQITAALTDKEAELFKLRYINELEIEDIAKQTNNSIASVYKELSRIRIKIRKIFSKDYFSS